MRLIIYKLSILFFLPLYLNIFSLFFLIILLFIFIIIICMEERKSLNKEIQLKEIERRERVEVKRDGWLKVKRKIFHISYGRERKLE